MDSRRLQLVTVLLALDGTATWLTHTVVYMLRGACVPSLLQLLPQCWMTQHQLAWLPPLL
jgi:hypothetical protein